MNIPAPTPFLTTAEVRRDLVKVTDAIRARHPWLQHQSAIGALLMTVSLLTMLATTWAYATGNLALGWTVLFNALATSVIHELEHDTIHLMYFRTHRWARDLMLGLGWLARPTTANPWLRRAMHLHHHKASGTASDVEERGLTNGEPWGLKRLVMLFDGLLAVVLRPHGMTQAISLYHKANPKLKANLLLFAYLPLGHIAFGTWYLFLYETLASQAAGVLPSTLPAIAGVLGVDAAAVQAGLSVVALAWLLPNILRSACLYFVSSNMHYYGDIDPRNVHQQTQVMDSWWLAPFNFFCCNFGATHTLHHYQVGQPFYVRAMSAKEGNKVLARAGVRFNDWGTFGRANRWSAASWPAR